MEKREVAKAIMTPTQRTEFTEMNAAQEIFQMRQRKCGTIATPCHITNEVSNRTIPARDLREGDLLTADAKKVLSADGITERDIPENDTRKKILMNQDTTVRDILRILEMMAFNALILVGDIRVHPGLLVLIPDLIILTSILVSRVEKWTFDADMRVIVETDEKEEGKGLMGATGIVVVSPYPTGTMVTWLPIVTSAVNGSMMIEIAVGE